jgi:hypothetical protein
MTWDPDLDSKFYHGTPPWVCDDFNATTTGSGGLQEEEEDIHLATFKDTTNNTIDIWCKWSEFLQEGTRQFIVYYNNITVIGQCPYKDAVNYFNFQTDDKTGIINRTIWISTTPDMKYSVTWNMTFNDYNTTAMAHRGGINDDVVTEEEEEEEEDNSIAAGLFWDMYS